jgi:CubicO group peptidase (beta-lactamase class C family)
MAVALPRGGLDSLGGVLGSRALSERAASAAWSHGSRQLGRPGLGQAPAVVPSVLSSQPDLAALIQHFDETLPGFLERRRVPGVAIALIDGGELAWAKGYGLADKATGTPATADTVFQVASLSKSVTAFGVLRLVERGLLELEAPVEQYLTRWHLPPSPYDADGVTIRRLLSHTAGLPTDDTPGFDPDQPLPTLEAWLNGEVGPPGGVRVVSPPGAAFGYSGGGYTLLQLVVEEVTGEPFAAHMRREILTPLGMASSSFEWEAGLRGATATPYSQNGRPLPVYQFVEQAAAGLYSSARGFAAFLAAEMAGPSGAPPGRGVLGPELVARLFQPEPESGGIYGLGHFTRTLESGARLVSHGGTNRGWKSTFLSLPDQGRAVAMLSNGDTGTAVRRVVEVTWLGGK